MVGDVIQFEDLSSNIIVDGNEWKDYMTALSGRMAKTDIGYGYEKCRSQDGRQTCSNPLHHANHSEIESRFELSRFW